MTEKTYDLKRELSSLNDEADINHVILFILARLVIDESTSTLELHSQLKQIAEVFPDSTPMHSKRYLHLKENGDVRFAEGSLIIDLIHGRQPPYTQPIEIDDIGVQISHLGYSENTESKQVFMNADILVLKLEDVKKILTLV